MVKDIAIFGAGGFGREVACLIRDINDACYDKDCCYNFIGFFDDNVPTGTQVSHYGRVLGGISELNAWSDRLLVSIAVGSPQTMAVITSRISNPNIEFPNLIHPDLTVTDPLEFRIGKGNIIKGRCEVAPNVSIGDFNCLIRDVVLGHDSSIGDFNILMPNVYICGEVEVGNNNLFGIGSIVLQQLTVGNNVHVGAGAVVFANPTDGCTYLGNPARKFMQRK